MPACGLLSPMFFFSGTIFPLDSLPRGLRPVAELLPLTHAVRLARGTAILNLSWILLVDLAFLVVVTTVAAYVAIRRLRGRIVV